MADLTLELPDYRTGDLADTVRRLYDHAGALTDQLRYVLMHLDEENIPALGGLQEQLADAEGNLSTLQQSAAALIARVENAEGELASVVMTAEAIGTRVESAESGLSTLTQTANSLSSTVSDLSGQYSKLQQTVDGFDFTGVVTFDDLDDELSSYPTKTSLKNGRTTISGDCITTGLVSLDYLDISNGNGSLEISTGSTGIYGTVGPCLTGPEDDIYMIVTDAACRFTAEPNNFYVSATRTHADVECDCVSDARQKNSIAHDVAERYENVYRALQPARFKFNNGTSDRYHTGFVAQEVEQALTDGGLTTQDLAALICDENGRYAIRYGELVALNTAMIQKLMERVDALEREGGNE